jgi:glycosyltransferase involved in cell wall biosynthesis
VKIIIASTFVPMIEGGGTFIVDWLDQTFKKNGFKSDVVKIPFHSYPPEMLEQMLAIRLLDLTDYADLLITIRTPSYMLKHPNKVAWFIHHHRGAYDLWGTPYQDIPDTPEGLRLRRSIMQADNVALRECRKIFTNSKVVSDRLKTFNSIDSEVLYPYYCGSYGDYIFYPSRITRHKRQYLAIESMRYTRSGVKLVIAGSPDAPAELEQVEAIVRRYGLESKVEIIGRWISQKEKVDLIANSLGCIYIPYDEDSYGYVSLEAYHSDKPVITCSDSGGTLEIVEDRVTGSIVPPDARALAAAMDRLYNDRQLAMRMGRAGRSRMDSLNISWNHVMERLVG